MGLLEKVIYKNILKKLANTPWNAHASAVICLDKNSTNVSDLLLKIAQNSEENEDARVEFLSLFNNIHELEFVFMMEF